MEKLDLVKEYISQGKVEEACQELDVFLQTSETNLDEAYYLYGNARRKQGNWQQALNNYCRAMDINPDSPARHAYAMVMDILNFYNKDMYNQ